MYNQIDYTYAMQCIHYTPVSERNNLSPQTARAATDAMIVYLNNKTLKYNP